MDQTSFVHLFQANDNFSIPQEIVFVEGEQAMSRVGNASSVPSHPQEANMNQPQEREVCPLTELCTLQVVTIGVKDNIPEVSEVTIPNALASSLRFLCKVCEKSLSSFRAFQQHAKSHISGSEAEVAAEDLIPDHGEGEGDSTTASFHADYPEGAASTLPSESSQMEAIARELIGLASSPQKKTQQANRAEKPAPVSAPAVVNNNGALLNYPSLPPEQVCCYESSQCGVCNTVFISDLMWEEHMNGSHATVKHYQCAVCGKELNSMPSLRGHVIKIHFKFSQKVCERKWNKQKKNVPGSSPVPCNICHGNGKMDPMVLKNSAKVIPPDDPSAWKRRRANRLRFQGNQACPICGKVLSNTYIRKHMRIHTSPKTHTCDFCHRIFRDAGDLTRHERTHTGERPYKCPVCGKAFTHTTGMSRHMKTHSEQKSYKCTLCEREFTRRDGLLKHMSIHNGEKPFQCSTCGEGFRQKRYLLRHYTTVHGFDVKTDV